MISKELINKAIREFPDFVDWEQYFNVKGPWDKKFHDSNTFANKHKKIPSAYSKDAEERILGKWCSTQRSAKRGKGEHKITQEREKLLESIVCWHWGSNVVESWYKKFYDLKTFVNKYKKIPSPHSKDAEEKKLGKWCQHQKDAKKGRGTYLMTPEREKLLESIPGWEWERNTEEAWSKKFHDSKMFVNKHKKLPSPHSKDLKERILGKWCEHQRSAKRGKNSCIMTPERIKLLESIPGWKWESNVEEAWINNFKALKIFVNKYKRFPSQYSKDIKEKKLGDWCSNQRYGKKGKGGHIMTPEREKLLESLDGWKW